jgi:hypothetical protein
LRPKPATEATLTTAPPFPPLFFPMYSKANCVPLTTPSWRQKAINYRFIRELQTQHSDYFTGWKQGICCLVTSRDTDSFFRYTIKTRI